MPAKEFRSASLVCYEKVLYRPVKGYVQSCKCTCSQKKSYCSSRFSPEKNFRCCLEKSCYIFDRQENGTKMQESKKLMEAEEASDCPARYASSDGSCSKGRSPYSSESTIPPKGLKGTSPDSDNQSVSSQFQLSKVSTTSSCSHVHLKLPDCDQLEAKFRALKKEHQLRINAARHGLNLT
ncbi:unnamed protein product [Dovyalis caffra]|uniref:Uncharacterized protein n=1 Tax=Dovyalis caffra TaxID=77055 RepID=A0AAV1SK57_9ROSI|nr:unnamed protein product [Dovyalis caffra]